MSYYHEKGVYSRVYNNQLCECFFATDKKILLTSVVFDDRFALKGATQLLILGSAEQELRGGRFANFDQALSTNPVEYLHDNVPIAFKAIVDWIAENIQGRWSFHLGRKQTSINKSEPYTITMFFENDVDATIYRLSLP